MQRHCGCASCVMALAVLVACSTVVQAAGPGLKLRRMGDNGAVDRMWSLRGRLSEVYGDRPSAFCLDATGERTGGTLADMIAFCTGGA